MKRYGSLEYLRVLACFLVILIHVSASYIYTYMDNYNFQFTMANFYDSISRVSVPIFVMLSGCFLLSDTRNKDYLFFYKKTSKKIFLPTIIWSFIYVIYLISIKYIISGVVDYKTPLYNWLLGAPFYHLWYLYMIIGLYLSTPLIIILKEKISPKFFFYLSIFFIFIGFITTLYFEPISFLLFIDYLGYFMIGNYLRENPFKSLTNYKITGFITALCGVSTFIITEIVIKYNLWNKTLYFYKYLSPFVIIGSIFLYLTFLNMKIESETVNNLSKHTFNIYILHGAILDLFQLALKNFLLYNTAWFIPFLSFVIFIICLIISVFLEKILNLIKK